MAKEDKIGITTGLIFFLIICIITYFGRLYYPYIFEPNIHSFVESASCLAFAFCGLLLSITAFVFTIYYLIKLNGSK